MAEREAGLSKRERQIMDVLFAAREASAADVAAKIPDPPTETAVRTLLAILGEKGHVTRVKRGRKFIYRPAKPRARAARSALRRLLETFFDGSVEGALATYLADPSSRLSEEEFERLGRMIEEARKK